MKKLLITMCFLSLVIGAQIFAEEPTYTETFINTLHKNIDRTAEPVLNQERELNARQKSIQDMRQQQLMEKRQQLNAKQDAQLELINRKKQQIQAEKDILNQQKNGIKNLFSVE